MWSIAAARRVCRDLFLKAPFPLIVLSAGLIGYIGGHFLARTFAVIGGHGVGASDEPSSVLSDEGDAPEHAQGR